MVQSIILITGEPEMAIVNIDPHVQHSPESLEDSQRTVYNTVMKLLITDFRLLHIFASEPEVVTISGRLIDDSKAQLKEMPNMNSNPFKELFEVMGRLFLAEYLYRYNLYTNPDFLNLRFRSLPLQTRQSNPLTNRIEPPVKSTQKSETTDYGKAPEVISGSEVLRRPVSPEDDRNNDGKNPKKNEARDRAGEFIGLKEALNKLQTKPSLSNQTGGVFQSSPLTIEVIDQPKKKVIEKNQT